MIRSQAPPGLLRKIGSATAQALAAAGRREPHAGAGEHALQHGDALVDLAAAQALEAGAAQQVEGGLALEALGGAQVGLGCLDAAAVVGEGITEQALEVRALVGPGLSEFGVGEGNAVEGGGAVEGEGGAGPGSRLEGVVSGAGGLAGGRKVAKQALGVGVGEALEGLAEGAVDRALARWVDVLVDGRTHTLVEGLDGGLSGGPVAAQQVVAAKLGDSGEVGVEVGDGGGESGIDWFGGDGHDLEEGAGVGIEAGDPAA